MADGQVTPWSGFKQIASNRLGFYFDLGTGGCYRICVAVEKIGTSVEVTTIIDRPPNTPGECTLGLRKASVTVETDKPIGEHRVSHLEGIQLH